MPVYVQIAQHDALQFPTDILVLKFAQGLYGVDHAVVKRLFSQYEEVEVSIPQGQSQLVETNGRIVATRVLFIGVKDLYDFGYKDIRAFTRRALAIVAKEAPDTRHLTLTLHGVGYGLDETQAFMHEIAGMVDALTNGEISANMQKITVVEKDPYRAKRLTELLVRLLPGGVLQKNAVQLTVDD